jgi:hypothetical protein
MLFKSFEDHGTAIVSGESGLIFTDFFSINSHSFKEKKRKFSFGFHRRRRNQ